jgi:hypothetical protein
MLGVYKLIGLFMACFAGWTLAANVVVLAGGTLNELMLYGPLGALLVIGLFLALPSQSRMMFIAAPVVLSWRRLPNRPWMFTAAALLAVLSLKVSWVCFWSLSVLILTAYFFSSVGIDVKIEASSPRDAVTPRQRAILLVTVLAAAIFTLWISRSDADDAFYVGLAAFTNGHSSVALMSQDPMHGEPNWPLIFPSYRFTSYELLMAVIAHVLGIRAMDVAYRVLPPLAAGFVVVSTCFLARELSPKRWLAIGLVTLLLGLILGECHRGAANFMFIRLFQGKAVYLSALLPLLYALVFRYARGNQSPRDILLLGCTEVAAIGISNFAMLAAPMAAGTAVFAVLVALPRSAYRRMLPLVLVLLIPLPYLVYVAIFSSGTQVGGQVESAETVWRTVFGPQQQYLVALLLLIGPAFAKDTRERIWLCAPPFLLLAIFLNPFLSGFISRYVTMAPVYWRVTWCLPVLTYLAWSLCLVFDRVIGHFTIRHPTAWLAPLLVLLLFASARFNVLRPTNSVEWHFAGWKVPSPELTVAQAVNRLAPANTSVAAPEAVSSIMALFEQHPRLVSVRDSYLDMLAPSIGPTGYRARKRILDFVSGRGQADAKNLSSALAQLDTSVMVLPADATSLASRRATLAENDFFLVETSGDWTIWLRRVPYATTQPLQTSLPARG